MWSFHQPNKNTGMVHQNLHANSTAERLVRTELEYAATEQAWNTAFQKLKKYTYAHRDRELLTVGNTIFLPLNPQRDLERSLLVHEEFVTRVRREELLAQRAELRTSLGLTR